MHIDHNKLLDLLTDASGIEPEKVEQQIGELIEEIQHAIADNEAYEIEGFGIFSGLGNRVLFIPSKELETEINFKYVGMEPIELEENQIKEEKEEEADPFEELQGTPTERKRDPFAGLVEGYDEEETEEEYQPGPDEWGIEAHKEDDKGANRLLSSLMGEEFEEDEEENEVDSEQDQEEDPTEIEDVEDSVSFDDIFGETESLSSESDTDESEQEESVGGLDAELANLMSEDSNVKSEDELAAGIMGDDDFADIFGEDEEEDNLEGEQEEIKETEPLEDIEEEEAIDELVEALSEIEEGEDLEELTEETPEADEVSEQEETETVEETEPEAQEESEPEIEDEFDDFDDPFLDLEDEEPEEEEVVETQKKADNIPIPVITNISSDLEPVKKEETKKKEKPEKEKKPKKSKGAKPAPVFLWIILALLIIIGTTVGLGYFSIITIPGITPQVASNTIPAVTPPPPVQEETPPPVQQEETPEMLPDEEAPTLQPPAQEQEQVTEVPVTTGNTEVPSDQNKYGMMGVASTAANDGYTIVLFSLSVEANAFAKQQELANDGFRALVTPISSAQYGTLWRVSVGQFATLTDAAIAAEDMPDNFTQSYFIKRITN